MNKGRRKEALNRDDYWMGMAFTLSAGADKVAL